MRWFELRKTAAAWSLVQEGTYAPDAVNRWMGAIAMDGDGNIALGYNVSSSAVFPGLRYTGREATDPAGTWGRRRRSSPAAPRTAAFATATTPR